MIITFKIYMVVSGSSEKPSGCHLVVKQQLVLKLCNIHNIYIYIGFVKLI